MDKEREDRTSLSDLHTDPDVSLERSLQGSGSCVQLEPIQLSVNVLTYCCHEVLGGEDLVS